MKAFFTLHHRAILFLKTHAFWKHRSYFFWSFGALLSTSFIGVLLPLLAKMELDQLSQASKDFFHFSFSSPILVFALILGCSFVLNFLTSFLEFLFGLKTNVQKEIMSFELKKEIFSRLSHIDPGYTLMNRFRRMSQSVTWSVNSLPGKLETLLKGYLGAGIEFLSIAFVSSFFDIRIFLALIVLGILNYKISIFSEYFKRKHELHNNYELDWEVRNIEYTLEDNYQHISSHGGMEMLFERYIFLKKKNIDSLKIREKIDFFTRIAEQFVSESVSLGIKLFVGYLIFSSTASLGLMVLVTLYMERMNRIMRQFFEAFSQKYELIEDMSILEFFLEFIEEKNKTRGETLGSPLKKLEAKNLSFAYPHPADSELRFLDIKIATLKKLAQKDSSDYIADDLYAYQEARNEAGKPPREILHTLDMQFEAGKLYGIVGKNGAGKTTFTSLLLGFFSEYQGSLQLDGKEFSHIYREDIQKHIGYVSQEPYIMYGRFTIRDNLMLGVHKHLTDEELYDLLDMFGLKEIIQKQKDGLHTRLKWDIDLSGGQKQILALIRVILQDRSILILDEGTNQLDGENEMKIMNELLKNKKEKIIIFVTHRMNTMKKCDMLYVLKDGKIEDTGTPNELSKRHNEYARFLALGEIPL